MQTEPRPGSDPTPLALVEHTRAQLARYKAPRHIVFVESVERGANGKADYPGVRKRVEAALRAPLPAGGGDRV